MVTKYELRNTASDQCLGFSEGVKATYIEIVLDKVERNGINEILVKSKFILFLEISDFHDTSRQLNPMTI